MLGWRPPPTPRRREAPGNGIGGGGVGATRCLICTTQARRRKPASGKPFQQTLLRGVVLFRRQAWKSNLGPRVTLEGHPGLLQEKRGFGVLERGFWRPGRGGTFHFSSTSERGA